VNKVFPLKFKLFWDGIEDDGDKPVIAHDILCKLHQIELHEEEFADYQRLMCDIAGQLLDRTKDDSECKNGMDKGCIRNPGRPSMIRNEDMFYFHKLQHQPPKEEFEPCIYPIKWVLMDIKFN
jgi:hypothetical protein